MGTILPTTDSWGWSVQSQLETDIHDGFSILYSQPSSTFTINGHGEHA